MHLYMDIQLEDLLPKLLMLGLLMMVRGQLGQQ
nr:hypothetical protein Q903MT_gene5362 [Picea sitchensis]